MCMLSPRLSGRLDLYFGGGRFLQQSDQRPWPPQVRDRGYCAPSVRVPGRVPAIGRAFGVASGLLPGGSRLCDRREPFFHLRQSLPLLQLTRLVCQLWPHPANASSVPSVRGPGCLLDTRPVTVAGKTLADRGACDAFNGNIFLSL